MPRLYLVRHGRAAATFAEHADPGLDDLGRQQAEVVSARLAPLGALALLSSPLARAKETAAPLQSRWRQPLRIDHRLAEIPSDTSDLLGRAAWLGSIMGGRVIDLSAPLQAWCAQVGECLLELQEDTVIFSHFIAINIAVGIALGDDRLITFRPDNASVTIIESFSKGAARALRLIERGHEAASTVN